MLLAGDVREPYGAVYEAAMQAAAGGERSVDLESLNRIRSRWIDEGLKKLDEGANTVLKYDNQIVVPFWNICVRCGMPVIWKPTTIGCSGKGIRLHSACGSTTTGRNSMIL